MATPRLQCAVASESEALAILQKVSLPSPSEYMPRHSYADCIPGVVYVFPTVPATQEQSPAPEIEQDARKFNALHRRYRSAKQLQLDTAEALAADLRAMIGPDLFRELDSSIK